MLLGKQLLFVLHKYHTKHDMKFPFFWNRTPCIFVYTYDDHEDVASKLLLNAGIYTASCTRGCKNLRLHNTVPLRDVKGVAANVL